MPLQQHHRARLRLLVSFGVCAEQFTQMLLACTYAQVVLRTFDEHLTF